MFKGKRKEEVYSEKRGGGLKGGRGKEGGILSGEMEQGMGEVSNC